MNIREAKEEIKNTVRAYTMRDERGRPLMPAVRQRPVLLIGPPGIGKTAIMEQIAAELDIGLVAYTITHHTRQSAIGLPVIAKKNFNGMEFTVTEYTMSEIIASVYDCMERTGKGCGILFIDEINCVSETLHPTMLQFLQCKMFGSHRVPDGWVIVAAGNPQEYNKSARDFDIVTLDRVKRVDVEADVEPWRDYAIERGLHPGVVAYLSLKKGSFFKAMSSSKETAFVTARGWEDLSAMLLAYEDMRVPVTPALFPEYIHDKPTADDFALYYELYRKYSREYDMARILDGTLPEAEREECARIASEARLDERMTIAGLIMAGWQTALREWRREFDMVLALRDELRRMKSCAVTPLGVASYSTFVDKYADRIKADAAGGKLTEAELALGERVEAALRECVFRLKRDRVQPADAPKSFAATLEELSAGERTAAARASGALERGFAFAASAFGSGPEPLFLAEDLTRSSLAVTFLKYYGCEGYFKLSELMLINRRREKILQEIDAL